MKRLLLILAILPLSFAQPLPAAAKVSEFRAAYNRVLELREQNKFAEAEPFALKALALGKTVYGENHSSYATLLGVLAGLYIDLVRLDEAEPLYNRALAIREKVQGPNHPKVATTLNNLASLYSAQGRYAEAVQLLKRALIIDEKNFSPNHHRIGTVLNNLAVGYRILGRFAEAEPLFKRSLAIRERALGDDHPSVAMSLNNLAGMYQVQGRFGEAEPLYKRSLAMMEETLGPDHPDLGLTLGNLADLYRAQGRRELVVPLYRRSIAIAKKVYGPDHRAITVSMNNLATHYMDRGKFDQAEPLLKRSLVILQKALGADHPNVGSVLNNLGGIYLNQERYAEAEPMFRHSLEIAKKNRGKDHASVGISYNNLAELYHLQKRHAEAVPLYKRALAIREKALGPNHPDVASALGNLARVYRNQNNFPESLRHIRRAAAIQRARAIGASGGVGTGRLDEQKSFRKLFFNHLGDAFVVSNKDAANRANLIAEGFESAQLAMTTSAGAAVANMGARFAAGSDALAGLVRDKQDAIDAWQRADTALFDSIARPPGGRNAAAEKKLRRRLSDLDTKLGKITDQLATSFPNYAELTSGRPVALKEVGRLLQADEALLTYVVGEERSFAWVVRRHVAKMFWLDIKAEELNRAVQQLRDGLDPLGVGSIDDIPPFDTTEAYGLYNKMFGLLEPMLEGVRHVFVVADGALQSLPLGVLVTAKPQGALTDFSGYRQVLWLARKYALTTLPSVSSLRALRTFAKRAKASIPFMGFGDPLLKGHPGSSRGVKLASLYRGNTADVDAVRNLPPLPDTADELRSLSAAMKGDGSHIYLGKAATEKVVKSVDLSSSRIVAFATHGLLAGDMEAAEPALVLTPPKKGTALDDGLLTASEVAQLKLNADLVILSACNTAGGDGTDGAEGLSGLAKAFFYAGSRALLVSHWPVFSDAAVKLTTGMLGNQAKNSNMGWAEALRLSMLALMNNAEKPHYAHPLFWAPFVVVGEGGATGIN